MARCATDMCTQYFLNHQSSVCQHWNRPFSIFRCHWELLVSTNCRNQWKTGFSLHTNTGCGPWTLQITLYIHLGHTYELHLLVYTGYHVWMDSIFFFFDGPKSLVFVPLSQRCFHDFRTWFIFLLSCNVSFHNKQVRVYVCMYVISLACSTPLYYWIVLLNWITEL